MVVTDTATASSSAAEVLLALPSFAPLKRTAGEEQWLLARETRKAAKLRLDDTALAVQQLAAERSSVVNRLDRQQAVAEAAMKVAKRRLQRAKTAMKTLSEVILDVDD